MRKKRASPLAPAKNRRNLGLGCAIPIGLFFAFIGLAGFWAVTVEPLRLVSASSAWVETPCEIVASEVIVERGSKNTHYRIGVLYRYEWPPASGQIFESGRHDFADGSGGYGLGDVEAAVAQLPPGLRTVCYVDPADPASAVLVREAPGSAWLGFIMLLFPAFGVVFIVIAIRGARAEKLKNAPASGGVGGATALRPAAAATTASTAAAEFPVGESLLRPASGRGGAFAAFLAIAIFWNGIILLFITQALGEIGRGAGGWLLLLFLTPFALVGLVLIGMTLHAFSRLFAPAVELRLDLSRLRLGQRVPFSWRLRGRGVRKLTVRLHAREEASYRRGKNLTTDRSDFHRAILFESTDTLALAEGRAELVLPAPEAAAPAFAGTHNKLVWELVLEGEIPWRADVDEHFPLPVRGPAAPPPPDLAPEPLPHSASGLTLWSLERFAPGETLVFTLARDPGRVPASDGPLTIRLGWFTEGRGDADAEIVWSEKLPGLDPGAERGFELRLPEAPWSCAGQLVTIAWRLEVLDAKDAPLVSVPLLLAPAGVAPALPALPPQK